MGTVGAGNYFLISLLEFPLAVAAVLALDIFADLVTMGWLLLCSPLGL